MTAVENLTPAVGTAPACHALGLPRASLYRMRQPIVAAAPRPAPQRTLAPSERQTVCRRSPEPAVFWLARDSLVIIGAEGASGLTG